MWTASRPCRSDGFTGILPVLDNELEFDMLSSAAVKDSPIEVGTAHRLGRGTQVRILHVPARNRDIRQHPPVLEREHLAGHPHLKLRMLHFFVNTGIRDTAYYWNELRKALDVYCTLQQGVSRS